MGNSDVQIVQITILGNYGNNNPYERDILENLRKLALYLVTVHYFK